MVNRKFRNGQSKKGPGRPSAQASRRGTHMLLNSRKIKVEIRFLENPGSVRAYADVTLIFTDGELQLIGCAIVAQPGKGPFVAYPANRGNRRYFPVVAAKGDLHKEIINEIMRAYEAAKARK